MQTEVGLPHRIKIKDAAAAAACCTMRIAHGSVFIGGSAKSGL